VSALIAERFTAVMANIASTTRTAPAPCHLGRVGLGEATHENIGKASFCAGAKGQRTERQVYR
jgi:hypothetical protein